MNALNLPPYAIKIAERDGKRVIFDELRRKYVALTPEEWVRQHFVHYLIAHKGYPAGLLANEVELKIGEKKLRCDSVLYNKEMQPQIIIEYKAPHITLTQKVFARSRLITCCCTWIISSFPTVFSISAAAWIMSTTPIISCRKFRRIRKLL